MTIQCKICFKEFEKQITNSHLKTHNINTIDYKSIYGNEALTCQEYKKILSEKRTGANNPNFNNKWDTNKKENMSSKKKGAIPWNKGKTYTATEKMKSGTQQREERYHSGEMVRFVPEHSEITKQKISQSLQTYATTHKDELSKRAKKAVKTKKDLGYDFGKNMRGKKHTPETKEKLILSRKINNKKRSQESKEHITHNATKANCKVVSFHQQYVKLQCLVCQNEFTFTKQYFTDSKLNIECCPVCFPRTPQYRSVGEIELFNYILSLEPTAQPNVRQILGKNEIDIYLPKQKIAIEYNGLYWHSEDVLIYNGKSKISDSLKRKKAIELGLRYISIFEDEWLNKPEIVKSRLTNILRLTSNVIYARKCEIKEIDSKTASNFCNMHHIQGKGRSNIRYGLLYEGELVSLMTFSKDNLSRKIKGWEINRFCSKTDINVVGGASRLFNYFVKEHKPAEILSYSDNRWSEGNLYKTLGFDFVHETKPNYWYMIPNNVARIHRFSMRKQANENKSLSESQLRTKEGIKRIWDCGSSKWLWKNNNGA